MNANTSKHECFYIEYQTIGSTTPWSQWGLKEWSRNPDEMVKLRTELDRLRTLHHYRYIFRVLRRVVLVNVVSI